jgi:hypothetical protein
MPRSNSGGKPNRNSGDTRKTDGKRDSNNHVSLGAQIPIHATLIGSNCCEALGITARGYAPVLELCRALVKAGHDPRRPLHAYRGDVLAHKVRSIGEGARLTVREDRAGPRFVAWEPFPRRVGAWVREKAGGVGSTPDQSDEPSAPPGAAVRTQQNLCPILKLILRGKGPAAGIALRGRSLVQPTQNNCAKGARDERQD